MLDPQAVLSQAGQGRAPPTWRVFTKERGRVRQYQTIQAFIEAYGAYQALRSGGLHPH